MTRPDDDDMTGAAGVSMRQVIAEDDEAGDSTAPQLAVRQVVGAGDQPTIGDGDDGWDFAIPRTVGRYLKADETRVIPLRLHVVRLTIPALAAVGGLAAAVALNAWLYTIGQASAIVVHLIWWTYLIGAIWALYRWHEWRNTWFVVTGHRIMHIRSRHAFGIKIDMVPLEKIRDIGYYQTAFGRLTRVQGGYGSFKFTSIGTDNEHEIVDFVPYPEWFYRRMCELAMPEDQRRAVRKQRGSRP